MNRRRGLAGIDAQTQSLQSYAALSEALNQNQVDALHSQLSQFRTALVRFASEHRRDILRNPSFRHAFQQMCASIGVDPLAGPRKGGWWSEVLGLGDWQHELGVQIVDICINTRERNGGLIEMNELIRMLSKLRGVKPSEGSKGDSITEDDVIRSIKTLEPLGAGYRVVRVGNKSMVCSTVKELDNDQSTILALAQILGGRFDEATLVANTKWTTDRARTAVDNMINRDGMCWVDEQEEYGVSYWVPSAIAWED